MKTLFQKTAARTTASEGYWRLLTSPIVEKKHVHFPTVNSNSREKCIEYIFHVIKNLHKEMHIFFSTIGDDGSRQSATDAASFVRVF